MKHAHLYRIVISAALMILIFSSLVYAAEYPVPAPKPVKTDMLVGAYYFPGWSAEDRWYCLAANDAVQHPLLGYYQEGNPEAADWHIKWALEHGVGFFSFDFYTEAGSQFIETALDDGFLKAKYIDKFKFCLNWCNHASYEKMTAKELEQFGDLVIKKYMTHPSYLKIDGKPVVFILSGYSFVKNLGVDGARKEFDKFRQKCKDAGLNGAYIVSCEGYIMGEDAIKDSFAAGIDSFCLYNYPYAGTKVTGPGKHEEASYADLVDQGTGLWKHWNNLCNGAFWPTVMPGWDRRPWCKDADLLRTGSTPALFEKSLRSARENVSKDKVVMIEAWNEWGEGSILEPSVERGFGYLDKVRSVFSPKAGSHKDVDPKSMGLPQPAFSMNFPSTDTWKFDFNVNGWKQANASTLQSETGALTTTALNGDPQITSPISYLKCSLYPSVIIRMRIESPEGAVDKSTGQIFWSTIKQGLSEAASEKFEVILDGNWHNYEIKLKNNPMWNGTMDQFRLDPLDVSGAKIIIDEIRFMKKSK